MSEMYVPAKIGLNRTRQLVYNDLTGRWFNGEESATVGDSDWETIQKSVTRSYTAKQIEDMSEKKTPRVHAWKIMSLMAGPVAAAYVGDSMGYSESLSLMFGSLLLPPVYMLHSEVGNAYREIKGLPINRSIQ